RTSIRRKPGRLHFVLTYPSFSRKPPSDRLKSLPICKRRESGRKNTTLTEIVRIYIIRRLAMPGRSSGNRDAVSVPTDATRLLHAWRSGDKAALDRLTPIVYSDLRRLAHRYLAGERPGHTLQTSALVNEAYIRLIDCQQVQWQDRIHF